MCAKGSLFDVNHYVVNIYKETKNLNKDNHFALTTEIYWPVSRWLVDLSQTRVKIFTPL